MLRWRQVTQKSGAFYQLVLSKIPFYAEMGGEIGDTGMLGNVQVIDCKRENGLPVVIVKELPEGIDGKLIAKVGDERRQAIACNHTATHILHYALRKVLGEHVEQKGSLVTPDSLRLTVFDNLAFPLKLNREDYPSITSKVKEMADKLDLSFLLSRKPRQLSTGQFQKE